MPTAPALPLSLPSSLPSAATASASVKAALPALTVLLFNGAIDLLEATVILIIGWTLSRWVWRWTHDGLVRAHYIDETLKPLIANIVSYAILSVTVVAVLGQFGVQTTSLIALLGAAGLAVGLALQGTLSNVASGVMLLVLRPFRVAEKVQIGDTVGTAREIGLFRTILVTDDGLFVSIPNSVIFSGTIINTSREQIRRTNFPVDIDHVEDVERARRVLLEAMKADSRVLKTPAPDIQVDSLTGAAIVLSVQAWVQNRDFGGQVAALKGIARMALEKAGINPPIPMAGYAQLRTGQDAPDPTPAPAPIPAQASAPKSH